MRKMKLLAALLALCLLSGLIPAATMEGLTIDGNADKPMEIVLGGNIAEDGLDIPPEIGVSEDDGLAPEPEGIDLSGLELTLEDGEGESAAIGNATGSLVKITRPLNGAVVHTGRVELWCTFINDNPSGGFSAGDAWKYVPMRVQILQNNSVISDDTFSDYSWLTFTDEGQQYATVYLMEAGTYTIRMRVPGNAGNVWDSIQVTAKGASVTPAPGATRAPITDDNLIVITSPAQGERVMYDSIPVYVKYQNNGVLDADLYDPIRMEVLRENGNLVLATDSETSDRDGVLDRVVSGEVWKHDTIRLDVGGNYTIRIKTASSAWDSVQVYAVGPTYPEAMESRSHTITPGQSEVTIDLAKEKKARLTYSMTTNVDPNPTETGSRNYVYYADFVEGGDTIIDFNGISDNTFTYDEKKAAWTCDGWIDYAGVKVGSTTLHMYMLVNGTRYDHHAVTVNVIDSSKISAPTPTPTATPAPKVKLSKCTATVKSQVYTGKALKPAITVKYGKVALKKDTDYSVTYAQNKAVGTATATLKGKGKYTGTKKVTFDILPPAVALSQLKAGVKSFTASWKKGAANTGYQLQYALKKSFSGAKTVKVAKARTLTATVKALKSGKTYYVRVRAYKTVDKQNYYSAWSASRSVKVK